MRPTTAPPDPQAAWARHRAGLITQRDRVTSPLLRAQIDRALQASDAAMGTAHAVADAFERARERLTRSAEAAQAGADRAVLELQALTAEAQASPGPARLTDAELARLSDRARGHLDTCERRQAELLALRQGAQDWLTALCELYRSEHRRLWQDRLQDLATFALTKLPGLDIYLEWLNQAARTWELRVRQADDADAYLQSLDSFTDAAALAIDGADRLCACAERLATEACASICSAR